MKKHVFMVGLLFFPILLCAQTLKKQNQLLNDSIGVINLRLSEERTANEALKKEVSDLKVTNDLLEQKGDSLASLLVEQGQRHEQETDSLFVLLAEARADNEQLGLTVDSLYQVVSLLENNLDSAVAYKLKQEKVWKRRKYFNFGYDMQEFTSDRLSRAPYEEKFSFSITTGRTFYLHSRPILDMIKFGLDWSYFDLTYGQYEAESERYADIHKAEVGMQFGPSVTINPVDFLKLSAYFRYSPSYSMVFDNEFSSFSGGYGSFCNTGLSIAYKVISIGLEYRWGTSNFELNDVEGWNSKDMKFFIGFRF